MSKITLTDILELSVAERIRLTQTIWDSVAEFPEAVALTDAQRSLLDERLDALDENPGAGSPWPEVKARILGSR